MNGLYPLVFAINYFLEFNYRHYRLQDEREQEGYEKPWDWKPHQKDERPTCEYEQPWDQRARNIEQNLLKAKSAKEIKSETSGTDSVFLLFNATFD